MTPSVDANWKYFWILILTDSTSKKCPFLWFTMSFCIRQHAILRDDILSILRQDSFALIKSINQCDNT